ncbi:MAG: hypothetical protein JW862_06350, partial [Anaerolineales bacterium]|nr:hypothetical protein [Anaerolineales bacterium]
MKIALLDYRKNYYTYQRAIIDKVPQAEYTGVHDLFSISNRLARKINALAGRPLINTFNLNNQFQDFGFNDYDLLHLFNGVSYARKPWVTGFETVVPRLSAVVTRHQGAQAGQIRFAGPVQRAFQALAGEPCKALLPWSNNAALIQNDLLAEI